MLLLKKYNDDAHYEEEEKEVWILCCDLVVLSVRLLQSPRWHTVFNASLKVFHLVIMMEMMVVILTFDTFEESFCSLFLSYFEAENLLGPM